MSSATGRRTTGRPIDYSERSGSDSSEEDDTIASYNDAEFCPSDDPNVEKAGPSTPLLNVTHVPPHTPPRAKHPAPRDTSDELKSLIRAANPLKDRCLMCSAPDEDHLYEYAHIMRHASPIYLVERMELLFGEGINLDTRYNITPSESKVNIAADLIPKLVIVNKHHHAGFDKGRYGFSPPWPILELILSITKHNAKCHAHPGKYTRRSYLEILPNRDWSSPGEKEYWPYVYIPLDRKEEVLVFRVEEDLSTDPPIFKTVRKDSLRQPLAELGFVKSHVHPIFMLINLAEKIHKIEARGERIPAEGIQTEEQVALCDLVRDMSLGWFDEPIGKALYDQDPQPCPGRTRSQTAAASLDGTTAVGSNITEEYMPSDVRGTGKRVLQVDREGGEDDDEPTRKKQK